MNRPQEQSAWILAAGRTGIAPANGALAEFELHELVAATWRASGFDAGMVEAWILGNGLAAGGNPARLCLLAAGFKESVPGLTVDTQCCSGLDAIGLAASRIAAGEYQCLVAGGAESASNAPLRARRLQDGELSFYTEAQFSPNAQSPSMAQAARALAQGIEKSALFDYAIESHRRVLASDAPERLTTFDDAALGRDHHPRALTQALCARGESNSVHNPATMAPLSDGACLLLLCSSGMVAKLRSRGAFGAGGARPLARVLFHRSVGADPSQPALAIHALLPSLEAIWPQEPKRPQEPMQPQETTRLRSSAQPEASLPIAVELMESFSAQAIVNRRALMEWADRRGLSLEINPNGGLLALGHPIGASGAVLVARLAHRLKPGQMGLALIASAGGLASAILLQGVGPD